MAESALPTRLRLADHACVRRHVTDAGVVFVIHDLETGGLIKLGEREWKLLSCVDGTRDLDGVLLAAEQIGAGASRATLESFLGQLESVGLVDGRRADGSHDAHARPSSAPSSSPAPSRSLDVLSGFRLRCDGRGSCCRLYASVLFSPEEEARARALCPTVEDAGMAPEQAFLPAAGLRRNALSATLVHGRCAYLGEDDRCRIHAAGGASAKPAGCRLFPAQFVDDGERVRVTVAVECACVLASVGPSEHGEPGEALVPDGAETAADLPPETVIDILPERVWLSAPDGEATRADLVRWSRALLDVVPRLEDAIHGLLRLATEVERRGLVDPNGGWSAWARGSGVGEAASAVAPLASLHGWAEQLVLRASRKAEDDAAWRSERDLARQSMRWVGLAAADLLDSKLLARVASQPTTEEERFYVRAVVHGYELGVALPLADALRDRAMRLLVARAMPPVRPEALSADPAARHPLALVEALMRGHGLRAYAIEATSERDARA